MRIAAASSGTFGPGRLRFCVGLIVIESAQLAQHLFFARFCGGFVAERAGFGTALREEDDLLSKAKPDIRHHQEQKNSGFFESGEHHGRGCTDEQQDSANRSFRGAQIF